MPFLKTVPRAILVAAAILSLTATLSLAATKTAKTDPKPDDNPVLARLIQQGARIYYLGEHSDLNGWFIVKDNQVQIGYTTADNKSVVMGVMFDENGTNFTDGQFENLFNSNPEVSAFVNSLNGGQGMGPIGTIPGMTAGQPQVAMAPPAIPPAAAAAVLQPGDRLVLALGGAAGVTVGSITAPQLMMIMDVNCPHCQATWRALRDSVLKNQLQIRMIPIGMNDEDERAAARLLVSSNPQDAWDKYVAGDKSQLAGAPDPAKVAAVRANHALIDSWHIQYTPYLVYRAKNGEVKVLQGEPEQAAAILTDIMH
jgi:thiol:disulfide interchange protein DsbG